MRCLLMLKSVSLTETWNQHSEYYSNSYFKLIYFNVCVIRVLKTQSCNQMDLVSMPLILSCFPLCLLLFLFCFQICFLLKIFRSNICSNTCGTLPLEEWSAFLQYANKSISVLEKDWFSSGLRRCSWYLCIWFVKQPSWRVKKQVPWRWALLKQS